MRFLYSVILLMNVINVHAMKKEKLTTKLERNYDLQLAQKKKEIESRKLLESVAKKQKNSSIRNDQQKNIKSNNSVQIKQKKNKQIKEEFHQSYQPSLSFLQCYTLLPIVTVVGLVVYNRHVLFVDYPCIDRCLFCI
jgi:hypothetical protein